MESETYIIMDIQDVTDYWETDLQGIKDFIISNWQTEHFDTEDEMNKHDIEVENNNDIEYLKSRLRGMDYTLFESEIEHLEWLKEVGLVD